MMSDDLDITEVVVLDHIIAILYVGQQSAGEGLSTHHRNQTEDTILKALKDGDIEMLDSIWKRVKNNRSLSKLQEEVGIREAMVQVTRATGQEPPKFEDHTPYSNRGMEDLLELNNIASAIKTEIILP